MKKVIMFMVLSTVLMSFVSGYTMTTFNTDYEEVQVYINSLFSVPLSEVGGYNMFVTLDGESVSEVDIICYTGTCTRGEVVGTGTVSNGEAVINIPHSVIYPNPKLLYFYTSLDPVPGGTTEVYKMSVSTPPGTPKYCTDGCVEGVGIVQYYMSTIPSTQSCDDYIYQIITDDPSCLPGGVCEDDGRVNFDAYYNIFGDSIGTIGNQGGYAINLTSVISSPSCESDISTYYPPDICPVVYEYYYVANVENLLSKEQLDLQMCLGGEYNLNFCACTPEYQPISENFFVRWLVGKRYIVDARTIDIPITATRVQEWSEKTIGSIGTIKYIARDSNTLY